MSQKAIQAIAAYVRANPVHVPSSNNEDLEETQNEMSRFVEDDFTIRPGSNYPGDMDYDGPNEMKRIS